MARVVTSTAISNMVPTRALVLVHRGCWRGALLVVQEAAEGSFISSTRAAGGTRIIRGNQSLLSWHRYQHFASYRGKMVKQAARKSWEGNPFLGFHLARTRQHNAEIGVPR